MSELFRTELGQEIDASIQTMKNEGRKHKWGSKTAESLGVHREFSAIQTLWLAGLWTVLTAIIACNEVSGQDVSTKPSIIGQPREQTVWVGHTASLSVDAQGAKPLAYQWRIGTNDIPGATNSAYLLTNAQWSDQGDYSVVVSNSFGTIASDPAKLWVFQPHSKEISIEASQYEARVLAERNLVSIYTFNDATVEDVVGNAPAPLNDSPQFGEGYQGGPDLSLAFHGVGGIEIPAVSSFDPRGVSGTMEFWLRGLWGESDYDLFRGGSPTFLTLWDGGEFPAFTIAVGFRNTQGFVVETEWTGEARILFMPEPLGNQWHHLGLVFDKNTSTVVFDGVNIGYVNLYFPLKAITRITLGESWLGFLDEVAIYDTALDPAVIQSHFISGTTVYQPAVSRQPEGQTVVFGQPVSFNVVAEGAGPLTYQWMFEANSISGATNSFYSLASADYKDSGRYSVVVRNSFGVVTSTVSALTVTPGLPPSISNQPKNQTVEVGDAVDISASSSGSKPFTVQWFKNGTPVPDSTNLTLSLSGAQYMDAGVYHATLSNAFGVSVSIPVKLVVLPPSVYTFTSLLQLDALLDGPRAISVDSSGVLYVSDLVISNYEIYRWASNNLSLLNHPNMTFNHPAGIAVDRLGNLLIADTGSSSIRRVGASGMTGTIVPGGPSLSYPAAIAVDADDNIYVVDASIIKQVTSNGSATTLAGRGIQGFRDGVNGDALFSYPGGVAVDRAGNLYVADTGNQVIRKMTRTGTNWLVSTVAGRPGIPGNVDGFGSTALFNNPQGIASDAQGTLYIADSGNQTIRKVSTSGLVTTIAGLPHEDCSSSSGTGPSASFCYPLGIAVDAQGNVFVADYGSGWIYKGYPAPVVPFLSNLSVDAGSTVLYLNGLPMHDYEIQSATSFKGPWQTVSTNVTGPDGRLIFTDRAGSAKPTFFYRAIAK